MGQHGLPVPPLPTTVVVLGGQKSVRPAGSAWIQLYGAPKSHCERVPPVTYTFGRTTTTGAEAVLTTTGATGA